MDSTKSLWPFAAINFKYAGFDFLALPIPQAGTSRILFTSNRDGSTQIYVMNTDGSGQTRLTCNSANDDNPRWSPNGSKILFQSDRDNPSTGYMDIYVMNPDGSGQTRLTSDANEDSAAVWSPDGTKIMFQSFRNGINYQVYVMNADGSGQVNVSNSTANDTQPSWSPDGAKIGFASDRDHAGLPSVYVMNANGTNQIRLTFSGSGLRDEQPVWSPNATKLAFTSTRDSIAETWQETDDDGGVITKSKLNVNKEIYVMNADGSGQTRLTNDLSNDDSPRWSPDGTKIVFRSDRERECCDPTAQVWTMNPDGSNPTLLSSNQFGDYSPSWGSTSNQSPVANAGGPYSGMTAQTTSFNGGGSFDPDGSIVSYSWSFGDGGTGSGVSPTHAYATAGTYNITLTVTDGLGAQASTTTTATISNQSPVANAGGPYNDTVGQSVSFNGAGSSDPDGSISSYSWNFGDGGTGSGVAPTHAYSAAGTYNVTLTVTDNLGAQASTTATASISAPSNNQFVQNFYQWALLRQPSGEELSYWTDIMRAAYPQGQGSMLIAMREFGMTVFESAEYAARNRSNHDYAYDLYKTFLMREPDQQGWEYWIAAVPLYGREHVRRGFDESTEFINLAATLSVSGAPSSNASSLMTARVDPFNQPGSGLLARDAEWSVPLVSLPGRAGLDLGLSLSYSSMVWTRSGPYLYFEEDNGSLSPGFRLGFPTIQEKFFDAQVGRNVYLLRMPGGGRVELRQAGASNVYEAADSSYFQLIEGGSLLLRTTDGTQLTYWWFNHEFRCVEIKDRNGNYLNASYDWRGDITNVTDTVGRVINFNYDPNANLISITQNGRTQPWATFGWGDPLPIHPNFSGASVVGTHDGEEVPVLRQVGLADGSYFTFQYTGAGQVNVIRRYRSDNVQSSYTAYDYQSTANDCPRLSQTRVWAENWTGLNGVPAEVVTQFSDRGDGSHVMTTPDGTSYKEFYGGAGGSPAWQRGLVIQSEVWSGGVRQKWTTTAWTQDNTGVSYQTNPRVTEANIYDASGNRRRTVIDYAQYAQYGLPNGVFEYAADGTTLLRVTYTDYNLNQAYLDRHIIGLVSAIHVSDGAWQVKRVFEYDAGGDQLQGTAAAATQHDAAYGTGFVTGRGNLSAVHRYDATDTGNESKKLTTRMGYDTDGSLIFTRDHLSHQSNVSYTDGFSDSVNRNTFAYPTTATDADGNSSFVQYNYDFGAKTRAQGPPPAGQSQGVIQTMTYDGAARLQQVTTTNTGAYTRYVYGPDYVQSFSSVNSVADDTYAIRMIDGVGHEIGAANNHPGSSGGYRLVNTIYDQMGRAIKQSNPTEIDSSWVPSGDDAAGMYYTQQSYDWKGRPLVTTNTDGTQKYASYGGCGCAGGEVVMLTDEVGRQQKVYSDALGRTWKTEVLNDDDSVYSAVVNVFNARDQVVKVKQYSGPASSDASSTNAGASCPTGTCQETAATFDGYARLQTKHVPEQDAGTATTYAYNTDDTVQSVTDARGAAATYSYNARHLATAITYSAPYGITPTSNVSFAYDAVGNRTSMTDGVGSVSYSYNQLSQMTSETRTFTGVGTYTLGYDYNLAGELKKITDPTNVTINYNYDSIGQMTGITGENNLFGGVSQYASGLTYRASGGLKSMTYGNNYTLAVSYNARLQGSLFEVAGGLPQSAPAPVMKTQYQYYDDGSLKFADGLAVADSDSAYSYDQAGRLKEAYSGSEALDYVNGTNSGTATGPYRQTYQNDAFGNLTSRVNRYWSHNDSFTASYTNNRQDGFQYDADGRLNQDSDLQYFYDAAGQNASIFSAAMNKTVSQSQDGYGQQVKRVETQQGVVTTTYYVRSSVLGGRIVTELNQSGQKQKGYVFAGGQVLARQEYNTVVWQHQDPLTGTRGGSYTSGLYASEVNPDPTGVNLGFNDPHNAPPETELPEPFIPTLRGEESRCVGNPNCTTCILDGFNLGCELVGHLMDLGILTFQVTLTNGTRRQVPIEPLGLGIYRRWVDDGTPLHIPHDDSNDDVVRVYRDEINGHWQLLSFSFGTVLPQDTSPDKYVLDKYKKKFNAALTEAEKRLSREECAKLFGKTAEELIAMLQNTEYRILPLASGGPKYDPGTNTISVTGAQTNSPTSVFINSKGPFLGNVMFVPGAPRNPVTLDFKSGLRGAQFGALLLLHELGHQVKLFGPDAGDYKVNLGHTKQVLKACF